MGKRTQFRIRFSDQTVFAPPEDVKLGKSGAKKFDVTDQKKYLKKHFPHKVKEFSNGVVENERILEKLHKDINENKNYI